MRDHVTHRSENHRQCSVPVREEAGRRDDSHCFLPERLCSDRIATVHGSLKTKVRLDTDKWQLSQWNIRKWDTGQPVSLFQRDRVHAGSKWVFPLLTPDCRMTVQKYIHYVKGGFGSFWKVLSLVVLYVFDCHDVCFLLFYHWT